MSEVQYKDIDGNDVSLDRLCQIEPGWAASRIRTMTAEIEKCHKEILALEEKRVELNAVIGERDAEIERLNADIRQAGKWLAESGETQRKLVAEIERLTLRLEASRRCHVEAETANTRMGNEMLEQQSTIDVLRDQISQFQGRVLEKSAQVRVETGLRVEAEKRLADIMEILEPLDPPETYAEIVDKIAILANPDRYAADPLPEGDSGNE